MKFENFNNKVIAALIAAHYASPIFAKSMMGAAETLQKESTNIGLKVAAVGFAIGGIYLFLGKQEGRDKISQSVWGVLCISGSGIFIEWISRILQ